jgi:hypothetical protein
MASFEDTLARGDSGEDKVRKWLLSWGYCILPRFQPDNGRGPRIYTPERDLIAPDIACFHPVENCIRWVEVKTKDVFSHHRKTNNWVTGIDLKPYEQYKELLTISPWPIWILFLHELDRIETRDEPWPCPTGLFGQSLDILMSCENHTDDRWARGMVYWKIDNLHFYSTLEDINNLT